LVTPADQDSLEAVQSFVGGYMERLGFPAPARMQMELAVEEVFVNIASYAYGPGAGGGPAAANTVTVRCEAEAGAETAGGREAGAGAGAEAGAETAGQAAGGRLTVSFLDSGQPYNPLAREDPDTTLALAERPIGGLGVFLIKRLMDEVAYRFEAGQNILTISKGV
jgi:anti-sigma regulatory factor (Ser/Thr protein kinase)